MSARKTSAKSTAAQCRVMGQVWIEGPQGALLGNGRVELLEQVRAEGSITAAARAMGMSYRHAWELIDSMNRQPDGPLVLKSAGGRGGGGAHLTPAGERAIDVFHELNTAFHEFVDQRTKMLSLTSDTNREVEK